MYPINGIRYISTAPIVLFYTYLRCQSSRANTYKLELIWIILI